MAKLQPDDNELAQRGELGGYLDDVEVETIPPPPTSGPVPRLLGAIEGTEAIRAAFHSPVPLLLLRSTPGAGKSAEALRAVRRLAERKEAAALFVPTHRLGEQTQQSLDDLQVDSTRPIGVARVRLPVLQEQGDDAHACLHHEATELAALAGVRVRQDVCTECPHREAYQGDEGRECPAYAAGASKASMAILQQPLLSRVLASATRRLRGPTPKKSKAPPPPRVVFVDELPPLAVHVALDGARTQWNRDRLSADLLPDVRDRLEPVMLAVLRAAEGGRGGLTLRELLALDGTPGGVIEGELEDLRALDGAELWRDDLAGRLARRSLAPATRERALERLAGVARFTRILEALVDAAHAPDHPALRVDENGNSYLTTAARWTRRIRPYIAAGGRVRFLDATAPVEALKILFGDLLEVVSVEVEDAPGVGRRFLEWGHAARGRHTAGEHLLTDEIRGPLRRLAGLLQERGAQSVGILTHKPLADAFRAWLRDRETDPSKPAPAWCPDELAALVAAGVELIPGHYGAQRGLNLWQDCDVLATLGDSWPNLGASRAEALALGIDPDAWALEQTRAELLQAWGRARTVHRNSPVLVVHLGSMALAPEASWAPQWAGVHPEKANRGRPRSATLPLSDPATWAEERARLGLSARQHAALLGLSWRTYGRKAPRGAVEEGSGEGSGGAFKNQQKEVAHNPPFDVFEVSPDTSSPSLNSIPDYAPPKTPSFGGLAPSNTPSTDPLEALPARPPTPAGGKASNTTGVTWGEPSGSNLATTRGDLEAALWTPGRSPSEGVRVA